MGTFMSALDMAGVSLSLMHLDEQLLELLDGPSEAFGWPAHVWQPTVHKPYAPLPQSDSSQSAAAGSAVGPIDSNPEGVRAAVQACAQACIDAEPDLTRFDSQVSVYNITLCAVGFQARLQSSMRTAMKTDQCTHAARSLERPVTNGTGRLAITCSTTQNLC